jgi:hypothetical protein
MLTAAAIHRGLLAATATVQLRDVCVIMGPLFAGNTVRREGARAAGGGGLGRSGGLHGLRGPADADTLRRPTPPARTHAHVHKCMRTRVSHEPRPNAAACACATFPTHLPTRPPRPWWPTFSGRS